MASSMTKNMEKKLYAMINCIADNYGFDTDEAFEFVRGETDVDHIAEILNMLPKEEKVVAVAKKPETKKKEKEVPADDKSEAPTETSAGGDVAEKIAACKKNISLWQAKLDKGSVKDADKQREKIAKEKAKLVKLEAKAPAPAKEEEKPKAEPKKDLSKDKKEEKEKRIKRFSPVMASQLKKALEDSGLEMNDKLKKEFQQFIEDLADDDFRDKGLADHMRAFAKLKTSAVTTVTTPEPEGDKEVDELIEEMNALTTDDQPSSNAVGGGPVIVDVSIDELRKITTTAQVSDSVDTLWDADKGRWVKGPEPDEDEDVVEVKFNDKDYVVGEKTGRVYEVRDTGDVFAGFSGVGKFKGLIVS